MADGYVKAIDKILRESKAALAATRRVRESGGDGLLDLSEDGIPTVEGVEPAKIEPEPQDDGKPLDLSADGVPVRENAPGDAQVVLETMREADRAKDANTGPIDLAADGVKMREASYGGEDGHPAVYVQDANTLPLLKDLYLCVPEQLDNGSINLENEQVKRMIEDVEKGHSLSVVQLGLMKTLVATHADDIKALRQSGQGTAAVPAPDPTGGREVTDDDRAAGLIDLGDGVPMVKS